MIPIKSIYQEKKEKLDCLKIIYMNLIDKARNNVKELNEIREKIRSDVLELEQTRCKVLKLEEELKDLK